MDDDVVNPEHDVNFDLDQVQLIREVEGKLLRKLDLIQFQNLHS